ncbi:MAG: CoA transferase [Chloroflexi bacterium]|nr:CoA transferase [Chloroflexota bacterium]
MALAPTQRPGALATLRVVELGDFIAVPFAGKLLADLGAESIKIEPPFVGDASRRVGPFPGDVPDAQTSGLFQYLNTNKLGVTLAVEQPSGTDLFRRLVAEADVLLDGQTPAFWDRLAQRDGADPRDAARGTVVSVTGFGQTGPYRDYRSEALITCAASGVSAAIGLPKEPPLSLPLSQSHYSAGLNAAIAALLATFAARKSQGPGPRVDVSEAEAMATFISGVGIQSFVAEERIRMRMGHRSGHSPHLNATLPCKDGFVTFDTPQKRQWLRLLALIGSEDDPAEVDPLSPDLPGQIEAKLRPWLMSHTKAEIFALCHERRIPMAPVNTAADVLASEHLAERGMFVQNGQWTMPRLPFIFSQTPVAIRRPAPTLGEHNEEIFARRLGLTPGELLRLRRARTI